MRSGGLKNIIAKLVFLNPGVVLLHRGHLAVLETFLVTTRGWGMVSLASSGHRPGMLANLLIVHRTGPHSKELPGLKCN